MSLPDRDQSLFENVVANENWSFPASGEPVFVGTTMTAFRGIDAYHGTLPIRQKDLEPGALAQYLKPIEQTDIYPSLAGTKIDLTVAPVRYTKRPDISSVSATPKGTVRNQFMHEVEIHELLSRYPHPSVVRYLGCVLQDGMIVAFHLEKCSRTLLDRIEQDDKFSEDAFEKCMDQIESGLQHLHSLGFAHNDLSPANIMFNSDETEAILIDFDSCDRFGKPLNRGGWVGGWDGGEPIATFKLSSAECDKQACQFLRKWGLLALSRRPSTSSKQK